MAKKDTFTLEILTPTGIYLKEEVSFLNVHSEKYNLGILPGHAPLITTLAISPMKITFKEKTLKYAIGGGIMRIDKEKVLLLLNSIERADEVDIERALAAKTRAEERLKNKSHYEEIDVTRAKLALSRAINRIQIIDNKD